MRLTDLVLFLGLVTTPAIAHQPVLAPVGQSSAEAPIEVKEPEVSKAFFGQLTGTPAWYRIKSDTPFRFYAGITVPKIEGCPLRTRFSVDLLDAGRNVLASADGEAFEWWPWFEEFGKKWYWVGPELGKDFRSTTGLPAGTYFVRVSNAANQGRYVLAIGDEESFPVDVVIRTLIILPGINRDFWDNVTCDEN